LSKSKKRISLAHCCSGSSSSWRVVTWKRNAVNRPKGLWNKFDLILGPDNHEESNQDHECLGARMLEPHNYQGV